MDRVKKCVLNLKKGLMRVKWRNVLFALLSVVFAVWMSIQVGQAFSGPNRIVDGEAYEYVEVQVQSGDTAWKIQKELTPEIEDLRAVIHHLKEKNEVSNMNQLNVGETYFFLQQVDVLLLK